MEEEKGKIAQGIIQNIVDGHIAVFTTMKEGGLITEETENDFLEFLEVTWSTFIDTGAEFSINTVLKKIPNNSWREIFQKNHNLLDTITSKEDLAQILLQQDRRFAQYIKQ